MGDGGARYASVPERITWTAGFHNGVDKHVLGVLSTFANFKTGKGARMSIPALAMRAGMERRRVERALQRLTAGRWVFPHKRHRHATNWDINLDRLATNWVGAKMVTRADKDLTVNSDGLNRTHDLTVNPDALTVTIDGQPPDLTVKIDGPIPCTSDPLLEPQRTGDPQQLTLPPGDITDPAKGRGSFDASAHLAAIKAQLATLKPFEPKRRRREGTG